MNFLPLWTASVWPTNSGTMVERRDQVLRTFFWRWRFSSSTRFSSLSSTYGPLLVERPMSSLLLRPARHDVAVGRASAAPRLVALGRLAPGSHRMVALAFALAPAHRMIDGVHDGAAHGGPEPLPAHPARLAHGHVLVVEVADLADGGNALELDLAHLARGQLEVGVVAFLGQELGLGARAPAELPALARLQLDVVHERAEGDVPDGQGIAGQDVGLGPGHDHVARLEAEGGDDVALLAVLVVQESDARRTNRIVLDPRHHGRDADLFAPEIDVAEHPLGPAAPMPDGDPPVHVAAAAPLLRAEQALLRRLLRDLLVGQLRHVPPGRRGGLVRPDSHGPRLPRPARSCGRAGASPLPSSSSAGALRACPCASTCPRARPSARRRPRRGTPF